MIGLLFWCPTSYVHFAAANCSGRIYCDVAYQCGGRHRSMNSMDTASAAAGARRDAVLAAVVDRVLRAADDCTMPHTSMR
jgi:hypothetical protein